MAPAKPPWLPECPDGGEGQAEAPLPTTRHQQVCKHRPRSLMSPGSPVTNVSLNNGSQEEGKAA